VGQNLTCGPCFTMSTGKESRSVSEQPRDTVVGAGVTPKIRRHHSGRHSLRGIRKVGASLGNAMQRCCSECSYCADSVFSDANIICVC
jgi:hypothetical protein